MHFDMSDSSPCGHERSKSRNQPPRCGDRLCCCASCGTARDRRRNPGARRPDFRRFAELERAKASELGAWKALDDLEEATASVLEAGGINRTQIFARQRWETHREIGLLSDAEFAEVLAVLDGPETEHQAMWRAVEELEESSRAAAKARRSRARIRHNSGRRTPARCGLFHHLAEFLSDDDVVNDRLLEDVVGDAIRL
jgi:hypothetical protein